MVLPSVDRQSLLIVDGLLNGIPIKCVLDTGATNSLVSENFVVKSKLKTIPTSTQLIVADVGTKQANELVQNANVTVEGSASQLNLIVRGLPDSIECILGLDWFDNVDATIDPPRRILVFRGKSVHLSPDNSFDLVSEEILLTETIDEEDELGIQHSWAPFKTKVGTKHKPNVNS